MSIEVILFGVVAFVLVLDFVLKGIKRKKTQDDVERIGEEQSKKKRFNFNYILKRKRNILSFILQKAKRVIDLPGHPIPTMLLLLFLSFLSNLII